MTGGRASRTAPCDINDARVRLEHARRFLDVAELSADNADPAEYGNVSASLAVLAGIAASDAACCAALGYRSRAQKHRDALDILAEVRAGGATAVKDLRRLLDVKDAAQYGVFAVSASELRSALRAARRLVEVAERNVRL